jgi:hypothetical protein
MNLQTATGQSIYLGDKRSKPYDPDTQITNQNVIRIIYDYPLGDRLEFEYKSRGGFTKGRIVELIHEAYTNFYRHPAQYGIWGHSIKDLSLDGIYRVNQSNIYHLEISS